MNCTLTYIPEHLHKLNKPTLDVFNVGEELYYRVKSENVKKPYDKISLYNISHNRNFNNSLVFPQEDVLFNIDINDARHKYENLEILILKIVHLQNNSTYIKEITSRDDNTIKVIITLKHRPEPCMYPHSVFEIVLNETIVDKANYEQTLGRDNRLFKNIRSDVRQELTSIFQNGIIDSSQDIEIIKEL